MLSNLKNLMLSLPINLEFYMEAEKYEIYLGLLCTLIKLSSHTLLNIVN